MSSNIDKVRREWRSQYNPTLDEVTVLSIALSEAIDNAEAKGRQATAKSYAEVRERLWAILEADPIEQQWRHYIDTGEDIA